MSGTLSKRQQARNEKVLQDLVHKTSGNNTCADCQARNPAWASWSLGIFLCMRCAAIHRKLGTHISKVKSLSMDSWSNEQVENMKKVGNISSNRVYNPQSKKPPIPVDADEVDSAMERFIRSKYMDNGFNGTRRHDTGSTESDETPPPLPPKTPGKFSFRSASSIFPLSSKAKRDAAMRPLPSPRELTHHDPGSPHRNKASKVFGASLHYVGHEDTETKLAKLRDMGFADDQRNAIVLRGVNGNLEKAVEALIRLGEGGRERSPVSLTAPRASSASGARSLTPATAASGLSMPQRSRPTSPSNNPFDALDMPPAQPQSSQSTGTLQNRNPYSTTNPFMASSSQADLGLNQAFGNMYLAPSQPLFPHHTGGIPASQQNPQAPYQHSMTPPIPQTPHNYASTAFNTNQTYPLPAQPVQTGHNPFLSSQLQPLQGQLLVNTASLANFGNNPFTRSPTHMQSPTLNQIPEQAQQNFYGATPQAQSWAAPAQAQTYGSPLAQQQPPPQLQNNPFLSPQMAMPQPNVMAQQAFQPSRPDKASIMALYNMPQLAPQVYQAQANPYQDAMAPAGAAATFGQPPAQATAASADQSRGPPTSLAGNKNPFLSGGAASAQPAVMDAMVGNRSRDSMMALGMEWSNGRHSPDAFASLSARH